MRNHAKCLGQLLRTMGLFLLLSGPPAWAEAPAVAITAYNQYAAHVEARIAEQHRSPATFLAGIGSGPIWDARLRRGEPIIEHLTPAGRADPPGGLLHHWRGSAFVAGAAAADFERLMKNFDAYPQHFAPQIVRASLPSPNSVTIPDHFTASMRIRQKHVITVVMDTAYDVSFGRLDAGHGYSISRSTRIVEIRSPGSSKEHELSPAEEHGFLWRLNTYWSYEERDGGLYMQIESLSLTRSIPAGLGWVVRPYVESVPRESLEFTLRATCRALKGMQQEQGR